MITTYILKKYTWIISHHHSLSTEIHLHIFMRLQKNEHIIWPHPFQWKEQDIFIWLDHYFLLGWQTERKTKCVLIIFTRLEQSWLFAWMKCLNNTVLRRKKRRKKKRERNHHLSKYVPDKLFFGKIVMPIPNRSLWICNNVSSAGVVVWSRTT